MASQKKSYGCLALFWVIFLGLAGYLWFTFWVMYTDNPQYESIGQAFGSAFATAIGATFAMLFAAVASVIFFVLFVIWICLKSKK